MISTCLCGWSRWRQNIFKARLKPGILIVYNIGFKKEFAKNKTIEPSCKRRNAISDNELKMSVAKKRELVITLAATIGEREKSRWKTSRSVSFPYLLRHGVEADFQSEAWQK